eukprot:1947792-Amphidinium_carterae.1
MTTRNLSGLALQAPLPLRPASQAFTKSRMIFAYRLPPGPARPGLSKNCGLTKSPSQPVVRSNLDERADTGVPYELTGSRSELTGVASERSGIASELTGVASELTG